MFILSMFATFLRTCFKRLDARMVHSWWQSVKGNGLITEQEVGLGYILMQEEATDVKIILENINDINNNAYLGWQCV